MKKFILPSLLAVLVCLPQSVLAAEEIYIDRTFHVGDTVVCDFLMDKEFTWLHIQDWYGVEEAAEIIKHEVGTGADGQKLYKLDTIICVHEGNATLEANNANNGDDYEIYFTVSDYKTAIGWNGGNAPDPAANEKLFCLHLEEKFPIPVFFVCTEARVEKKKIVREWEQIPLSKHDDYEFTDPDFLFISPYWYGGEYIVVNGAGESDVTMHIKAGELETKSGKTVSYLGKTHTFTIKDKAAMEIDLSYYPNKADTLTMDDDGYTMTAKVLCDHFSVKPEGGGSRSPSEYGVTLDVHLTPETPSDVVEITTDMDENGLIHCIAARDYGTAYVVFEMPETAENYGVTDTLRIEVEPENKQYQYDQMVLGYEDDPNNEIEGITMTEGDTTRLPQLINPMSWELFRPRRMSVEMTGKVAMPMDGDRVMDSLVAYAAGTDVVVYTYNRAKEGPFTYNRLPVHIDPLLEPINALSLVTNPAENGDVVLNAYYNGDDHQVEINDPTTDEAVQEIMAKNACGTEEWKEKMPNSMSFNLPAGKVTISFLCWTNVDYELHALVRGQVVKAFKTPTGSPYKHSFTVKLDAPTAVVFYLVDASTPTPPSNPDSSPVRKIRQEEETPTSYIKDITIDQEDLPTAIEEVSNPQSATNVQSVDIQKVIRDGKLLIIRDGKAFTLQGVEIR